MVMFPFYKCTKCNTRTTTKEGMELHCKNFRHKYVYLHD